MNHLLRAQAPISDAGWELLDSEARDRVAPALAARKLVDFSGPHGWDHSATNLGRTEPISDAPCDGVVALRRRVLAVAEVRAPFAVSRDALPIDTAGELGEDEIARLLGTRGYERQRVFAAADRLRREVCGDVVSYVVTRNIQYTNVCYFRCGFCAFSKGKLAENLRGPAYLVPREEILRRCHEAWERGAVEVCLQGGIHPAFTGDDYVGICEAIKAELPDLHVHAFSALEIWQGAATLGVPLESYLQRLSAVGLASLPGAPVGGHQPGEGRALAEVAERHGASPVQVALAWQLARSPQILPIPGTSSVAHLEENVAAAALVLDEDDMRRLAA